MRTEDSCRISESEGESESESERAREKERERADWALRRAEKGSSTESVVTGLLYINFVSVSPPHTLSRSRSLSKPAKARCMQQIRMQ